MLGLMCVAFLSACDKPTVDNPEVNVNNPEVENTEVNNENPEIENTDVQHVKTSLNNEELDELEKILLPVSCLYERYTWTAEWLIDSWEYIYNEWDALFPSLKDKVSREIESSAIEDGMIYTSTIFTMDDGRQYAVLYVNDPDSLQFVAASVSNDDNTALYTFKY